MYVIGDCRTDKMVGDLAAWFQLPLYSPQVSAISSVRQIEEHTLIYTQRECFKTVAIPFLSQLNKVRQITDKRRRDDN